MKPAQKTQTVHIGKLAIGGGRPVAVQSMLSAPAGDVQANIAQAQRLEAAGCAILRVSVPTQEDVRLVSALKQAVELPIVADIHFDWRIALACVEAGVDKIRINPGNIGSGQRVAAVADACREKGIPIRIGVNGGSLEKQLLRQYGGPTPEALVASALQNVQMLEAQHFTNIVISLKSSHVPTMVVAYRLLSEQVCYPLHLGVTEAGTWRTGLVKNAVGIGSLLLAGIGDTLRVSLTADPVEEVKAGYDILRATGHKVAGPQIICCPTCGRTAIQVEQIALQLEEKLAGCTKDITVAVMGCVVNGIGEGKMADIGIAGGKDSAVLFVKGQRVRTLHGNYLEQLVAEIDKL